MNPMKHQKSLSLYLIVFAVLWLAGPLPGQSAQAAAERMQERLPQVDRLKAEGEVGETAAGYLAPRESLGPRQTSIVEAENADRRIAYAAIAKRTGETVEAVGKQRAVRIAEMAKSGVWLQRPNGEWYRKP
jgi:uncharacterized protein YdbL (DUF1318 family)